MMGFWGVSNILLFTGLGIIGFFALNSAKEDDRTDIKEFFKLSGILISLSILCVVFIDIAFLVIQAVSWLLVYLFSVLKEDIFTLRNGYFITLLLVNAGGAYMVWELKKEREEEERFKEETANVQQKPDDSSPVAPETTPERRETPTEQTQAASSEPEKEETPGGEAPPGAQESTEEILDYKILAEVDISQRVAKTLHDAGIDSAKDLTDNSIDQLKVLKNLGDKSLEEIQGALQKAGLSLKAV